MTDGLWVGPVYEPDAYQLVEALGGGGEGEVWRAVRPLSEAGQGRSTVAVKDFGPVRLPVPAEPVDAGGPVAGQASPPPGDPAAHLDVEVSWSRHISMLQALRHAHIVRVLAGFVGPPPHWQGETPPAAAQRRYLVMEHIDARSLSQWCLDNPTADLTARLRIARQVASALDYLHSGADTNDVPVAHGDIKPANVLVRDGGSVILVDFGLANLADGTARLGMGTYGYIAPELIAAGREARPTPDSDRFAFAAMLVYLLTGQAPPQQVDDAGRPVDVDRDAARQALLRSPLLASLPFLADLVLAGLAGAPAQRPRPLGRWLSDVGSTTVTSSSIGQAGMTTAPGLSVPVTDTRAGKGPAPHPEPVSPPRRGLRRRVATAAIGAVPVLLLGGIGAWALLPDGSETPRTGITTDASEAPAVTPAASASASASPKPGDDGSTSPAATPTAGGQMPSVIDIDVEQAQEALAEADVEVVIEPRLVDDAVGERVVEQNPPAGTPLRPGQTVTLTVAQQPVEVYLADLRPTSGGLSSRSKALNGEPYPHSLFRVVDCPDDSSSVEYNLGRHYQRLIATVGIDDSSADSTKRVLFEVFADDRPVAARTVGLGKTASVDVNLTGVLRLRLTQTVAAGQGCLSAESVWGDPFLLGAPGEVPVQTPGS
ncbi:protein kinase domain-containing protein [Parafrankia sp. FMc2]|uniref:protein kinase domain-containing protein n=1 Tax=Parafrankia sp. FMc2 TaxID=3233196 RepID=UPI0034D5DE62